METRPGRDRAAAAWRRSPLAERALAGAGLALLVVSLLPWYHGPAGASANAWQSFGLLDLLLLAVALGAIAPFAGSALGAQLPRQQLTLALLGGATCAAILVAYRLLNPPGADNEVTHVAAGAWLGLLLCAAVAALAYGASRRADRA